MQGVARPPGADGVLEYSANADDAALPEAVRDPSPFAVHSRGEAERS